MKFKEGDEVVINHFGGPYIKARGVVTSTRGRPWWSARGSRVNVLLKGGGHVAALPHQVELVDALTLLAETSV